MSQFSQYCHLKTFDTQCCHNPSSYFATKMAIHGNFDHEEHKREEEKKHPVFKSGK